MIEAEERLVNLALYLSAARAPVTWEETRSDVAGYPAADEQDEAAFLRMFERDKKLLRSAGLVIDSDAEGRYVLNAEATYASDVALTPEDEAALRAAGAAFLADEAFPFKQDLRLALAKLGPSAQNAGVCSTAHIADESPELQGALVASIAAALQYSKTVTFEYTTSTGESATRTVEPYGAFVRDGRWYLVGRDADRDAVRTFALVRAMNLDVNSARRESPDFERPDDFDIAAYVLLPFQFGGEPFDAVLAFDEAASWRAALLTQGRGETSRVGDETHWRIQARSQSRLARWVIENGPGIRIVEPEGALDETAAGLREVAASHG